MKPGEVQRAGIREEHGVTPAVVEPGAARSSLGWRRLICRVLIVEAMARIQTATWAETTLEVGAAGTRRVVETGAAGPGEGSIRGPA